MRPPQELPIPAVPSSHPGGVAPGAGAGAGGAPPRRVRCVIGVVGGTLWWGGLLWLVLGSGGPSAAPVPEWVAAGGWGLGLIPLHAVPAGARRPRCRRGQS